ncbi:glycosyltransferase family 2 protein [uncultured Erythrobacter sp.]|uniref:glycosyltransferase family 2 protein n=1 Tax=uncultured Erythrobacter sp. TaxID=263913 RepID=UPI00261EB534|nr:glycosyltransferase family 2 protein [uncultured Erythrobacter sp.]
MPSDVLVVIVTYNSSQDIGACLDSILRSTHRLRVVILDNASSDDSADLAEQHPATTKVIRSATNLGFARGVNEAVKGEQFDLLLLLNPDTRLDDNCVDTLLECRESLGGPAIIGGISRNAKGEPGRHIPVLSQPNLPHALKFAFGLGTIPFTRRFSPDSFHPRPGKRVEPVPAIAGCLMLIEREIWERLGGFDEEFFMYGEDVDFCVRARLCGYSTYVSQFVRYVHIGGASSKSESDELSLVMSGRYLLYRRYTPAALGCHLLLLGILARGVAERLVGRKGKWWPAWKARKVWLPN